MGTIEIVGLITAIIPFLTKVVKDVFNTKRFKEPTRKGINALLPIIIGILSSGVVSYAQGMDWKAALAIGLGSGGVASTARDIEKNLIRFVGAVASIVKKK